MIKFSAIYEKAVNLFDDPTVRKAYVDDPVRFQRLMYPYLKNGIDEFQNPSIVRDALSDQTPPEGKLETFDGTGGATYILSTTPMPDAEISCKINGKIDPGAVYNASGNYVTFSRGVPPGTICSIEWYVGGKFNTDFSECATAQTSAEFIRSSVIGILARSIALAWAAPQKDNFLGVGNFLRDTDFMLNSNGISLRAQKEWYDGIKKDFDTLSNKLCWNLVSRKYHGGKFYG